MFRIAHEAPIAIFSDVQKRTDIDYALVHLFEENQTYYELFKQAVVKGREVILDNSIFELGHAFEANKFAGWVEALKPTWYIIPDVLEESDATIESLHKWKREFRDLPGKTIGVVQGKSYEDIVKCYKEVEPLVDMVGISFDYSCFEQWWPHSENSNVKNKYFSWVYGRRELLGRLAHEKVINTKKPHHLLGCGLPQEGMLGAYRYRYNWLYSVDTSNPVVHGIKEIPYQEYGLDNKASQKLFEMIDMNIGDQQFKTIVSNITSFRRMWNG